MAVTAPHSAGHWRPMAIATARVALAALCTSVYVHALAGCLRSRDLAEPTAPPAGPRIRAVASIPPQQYIVERVGGEHVSVEVLVSPGQSPHAFEPKPKQMAAIAEAGLYFGGALPFEKAIADKLSRAYRQSFQYVDLSEGIELRDMDPDSHTGGARGSAVGAKDPHIWLAPKLIATQAKTVRDALAARDPEHAATYDANLAALLSDLDRTDSEIASALEPFRGSTLLVFHPAFGYFADAYGLKQVAIEVAGKEPSARQLAAVIARAKDEGAKLVFVQPEHPIGPAETVAKEIGGTVVSLDPLAKDLIASLGDIARKVREGFAAETAQ